MNLSELQELGVRAIRPDAPSGDSARDTPEFALLQTEIRKLEAPDQPTVDWELVGRAGFEILAGKSKDLLVGSWVTVAAYESDGFAGMAAGLTLLHSLVDQQWATLFPERPRGRSASIEWLNERGARAVERGGKRATHEGVQACLDVIATLDDKLGSLLDAPPMLGEIRRALEEVQSNVPAPTPAPGTVDSGGGSMSATYTPEPTPVASGPPPMTSIENEEDLGRVLDEVARLGDLCAGWMRAQSPADPLGYRLVRILYWRQLQETPPNEDGATVLPDFDLALLDGLEQQLGAAEYAALIEQAELQFLTAPLWLDLTRYTVQALEAQGEAFKPAAEAVVFELAQTLKRVPDLVKLKTSGGVPFADDATKKWIAKRVLTGAPIDLGFAPVDGAGAARVRGGDGFADAQKEARKLARANKLGPALKLLADGRAKADRLEDRVAWKLEAARLCMQAGRAEMALVQLEALDDELRRSSIEDWDPALCAEILRDLLRCRQQVAQSADFAPSELARSRELMGRLCRLDVVSALELNGRE